VIQSLAGQGINAQQACIALGVSQSGYYAWKDRPDPPTTLRRIWLAGEIADIHKGVRWHLRGATSDRGAPLWQDIVAGHNAVEDIMRQLGLRGLPTRRLPRAAKLRAVTSQDLVRREFKRKAPNELWLTDITEHPTREGKVYCCAVLDTFSRKIVGWSIDSTQTTSLVLNALGMATQRRPSRDGLVIHSDRGVQFTSWAVRSCLNTSWGEGLGVGDRIFLGDVTPVREVLCGGLGLAGAGRVVGGG
jgi:putative transposase